MYCCTTVSGAPPQLPAKYEPDQKCPPPQVPAHVRVVLLAQQPGRDALEGVDQLGELDLGRVVHEQVDMVLFAVELLQLGFEVGAHLSHDLLAARQHLVGERRGVRS